MKKTIVAGASPLTKTIAAFCFLAIASMMGFTAAFGYGGGGFSGGSSAVSAAPVISAVNVPLPIGPSQEGTLSQGFTDGSSAIVSVPKGAVAGQTTFNVQQGSMDAGNTPVNTTGAILVGGQIFNITASDLNNQQVRNFSQPLTITLTIPNLSPNTSDLGVYYFNDATGAWTLIPGAIFDTASGKVTFTVSHLTKFAVFKTAGIAASIKTAAIPPAISAADTSSLDGLIALTKFGQRGANVTKLQKELKKMGYFTLPAATGYYGAFTKAAVNKYLAAKNAGRVLTIDELIALTKFGQRGANVTKLQKELKKMGYFTLPAATGYYGVITKAAVKKYQADK